MTVGEREREKERERNGNRNIKRDVDRNRKEKEKEEKERKNGGEQKKFEIENVVLNRDRALLWSPENENSIIFSSFVLTEN